MHTASGITKPQEIIVNTFSVSVSFCMFLCSNGHSIRASLPKYYLNDLRALPADVDEL